MDAAGALRCQGHEGTWWTCELNSPALARRQPAYKLPTNFPPNSDHDAEHDPPLLDHLNALPNAPCSSNVAPTGDPARERRTQRSRARNWQSLQLIYVLIGSRAYRRSLMRSSMPKGTLRLARRRRECSEPAKSPLSRVFAPPFPPFFQSVWPGRRRCPGEDEWWVCSTIGGRGGPPGRPQAWCSVSRASSASST
jgi:hypothetical protein